MSPQEQAHLYIGTPAYSGWVNYKYMFTILGLGAVGINATVQIDPWAALLTMSRNDLITEFYNSAEKNGWTHLLWLDADVGVDPAGIRKLLNWNKDAIAARVPLKAYYKDGMKYSVRNPRLVENKLYEVEAAATGCFLLSKKAAFALCEKARAEGRIYGAYNTANPAYHREVFDVFTAGVRDGEYATEDWSMCYQLHELGIPVYVDPTIPVSHFGINEWHGEEVS